MHLTSVNENKRKQKRIAHENGQVLIGIKTPPLRVVRLIRDKTLTVVPYIGCHDNQTKPNTNIRRRRMLWIRSYTQELDATFAKKRNKKRGKKIKAGWLLSFYPFQIRAYTLLLVCVCVCYSITEKSKELLKKKKGLKKRIFLKKE